MQFDRCRSLATLGMTRWPVATLGMTRWPVAALGMTADRYPYYIKGEKRVTGSALPAKKRSRRRLPRGAHWLTITIPFKIAVRAVLVTRRVQMGLSQADMASRMKVTRQAYQQLESPDANLRLDTLTRAFDALDVLPLITLAPRETPVRRAPRLRRAAMR